MTSPHLKHTPGPWLAKPHDDEFFKDVNILKDDGLACAVALAQGDITEDAAKANANLIAAAPDLLADCEKQIAWIEHVRGRITAPESVMLGFDQSLKYLRASVAKATGRA